MRNTGSILRRMITRSTSTTQSSFSINENLILTSAASYSTLILADNNDLSTKPLFTSPFHTTNNFHYTFRTYSSSPPSSDDKSNVVLIDTEEQFNASLRKAQDESLPAIFYFTAAWCGPCRMLAPVIGQLSEKYPHVTTYKIDIDKEGLGNALSKLDIHSVPTLHFFQDGKKAGEVVGADVQRLRDTMESLYKL